MFLQGLAALGAFAFFLNGVHAQSCSRNYTVQEGDTCDAISAAYNSSTYQLAALNPCVDLACDNLIPGEDLCLGTTEEDCQEVYVVQQNDTCDAIAASQGINTTMVLFNNPQIDDDCTNLYIGEVLCICDLVRVPEFQNRTSEVVTATIYPSSTADPSPTASDLADEDDEDEECEDEED